MASVRAKKTKTQVTLQQLKELVLEDSLKLILVMLFGIFLSISFVYLGIATYNKVQENRWLSAKIIEMQLTLENLEKEYQALISKYVMYNLGDDR